MKKITYKEIIEKLDAFGDAMADSAESTISGEESMFLRGYAMEIKSQIIKLIKMKKRD